MGQTNAAVLTRQCLSSAAGLVTLRVRSGWARSDIDGGPVGPLATRSREPGQARKGAAAAVDVGAGVWLAGPAALNPPQWASFPPYGPPACLGPWPG